MPGYGVAGGQVGGERAWLHIAAQGSRLIGDPLSLAYSFQSCLGYSHPSFIWEKRECGEGLSAFYLR